MMSNKKSKNIFMSLHSDLNDNATLERQDTVRVIKQNVMNKNLESEMENSKNLIPNVFHLIQDLVDLGSLVAKFFGPIFLAAFTSIFIVTTIQIYYCYTILYTFNEARAKTLWTLVSSVNVVIINVVMVFSLTSMCESIANQVCWCDVDSLNLKHH
jgi:gustatory receptor